MSRGSNTYFAGPKTEELLTAEKAGQEMLYEYCQRIGRQKQLSAQTGIPKSTISRIANGKAPLNVEAAMLFDVASKGVLPAEELCPSRAELIASLFASRLR